MVSKQRKALLATIIGSGAVFLDGSVVNLALPKIAASLHVDFSGLQWVIDGYLLTLSALILLGGSLGDIYGRKKVYFWGLGGFGLTSLVCALAPNVEVLVGARLVQGVFGALMVPGALAIIDTNFDTRSRAHAIGLWTAWTSGIIAVGPFLGGALMDYSSWRWIFIINVPLVALTLWLGASSIHESKDQQKRHVDFGGAVLAVVSLAALVYGLIEGPVWHWSFLPVAMLAVGLAAFGGFLLYEARRRDPMLPLRLFGSANFSAVNIVTFAMYGALGGFFFALLIYLQTALHYGALEAGLAGLPVSVLLTLLSGRAGALAGKWGPRLFMTAGPIVAGLGILMLLPLHAGSVYVVNIFPGVVLFGLGLVLTVAPLTNTVLASVARAEAGIASGVNNAVARVSGLVVIAVLGLFGAAYAYQFAVVLCAVLAIAAGLLSLAFIRNPKSIG